MLELRFFDLNGKKIGFFNAEYLPLIGQFVTLYGKTYRIVTQVYVLDKQNNFVQFGCSTCCSRWKHINSV